MNQVIIRRAKQQDAAEIANVHLNSWKETYVNLLPEDFLEGLHLTFKSRYELWKNVTSNQDQICLVAECKDHGIVGFITGGDGRDEERSHELEVYSIYLLKAYQGKKIGFGLLEQFFLEQSKRNYQQAYLWVLKDNPTIKFYEQTGACYQNIEKKDEIGGKEVSELFYSWQNLSFI